MQKKASPKNPGIVGAGRINRLFLLIFIWVIFVPKLQAQKLAYAYNSGEQVTYGAYYNWHFIWINSGEVRFSADTTREDKTTFLNLKAVGTTYKAYDLIYTVRDTFESRVLFDSFQPLHFRRVMNHARKSSFHEYWFDQNQQKIYSQVKRDDEERAFTDTLSLPENTFDLLSTSYFFRSFNFSNMKEGQLVRFKMLVDNRLEDLYFRYLGKEEVKTRKGDKFRCHKVSVMLLGGDFFPEGEHMKVWFTADENKLPVMVETKIAVGFVKAILTDYSNLKYPLTSKIN